jgi:hypothetical protein
MLRGQRDLLTVSKLLLLGTDAAGGRPTYLHITDSAEGQSLKLLAGYASSSDDEVGSQLDGEGPGTVRPEKRRILVTQIPQDYIKIAPASSERR